MEIKKFKFKLLCDSWRVLYEEQLFNLDRNFLNYVTKEDLQIDLSDKVTHSALDALQDKVHKMQTIHFNFEESLSQKLTTLRDDYENKTKEMLEQIADLNKKLDEIEDDDSYDEETEQDLDSELGDTLDVNDIKGDKQYNIDQESEEESGSD